MNLADMLGYADIRQLTRIAEAYRCECGGHSKHELIQAILQAVGGRDTFDARVGAMPVEDLRFIQSLLFDERDAFSLEELIVRVRQSRFESVEARSGGFRPLPEQPFAAPAFDGAPAFAQTMPGTGKAAASLGEAAAPAWTASAPAGSGGGGRRKAGTARAVQAGTATAKPGKRAAAARTEAAPEPPGPREIIARFKHCGWLFNGVSGPNRYLFQMPDDLKTRFRESLGRQLEARVARAEEPAVYRDEQGLMKDDLARLLRFAGTADAPLSQDGVLYRRQLQQLLELMAVAEEPPARTAWRFGYGRRFKVYPDRLALLYDYAHARRWLQEDGLRLTLTAAGNEEVEAGLPGEPAGLMQFWLRMYRRAVPNLPALLYWIDRLAAGWVTAASLEQALLPLVKPFYYDAPETVLRTRVIGMMVHMGAAAIGEGEAGRTLRMTAAGRSWVAGAVRQPRT